MVERGRVVAPRRNVRAEVAIGVADAVEVDAINVVAADDARRHVHDPRRGVGMSRIEVDIAVERREAVGPGHDPVRAPGGTWAMHVVDVVR